MFSIYWSIEKRKRGVTVLLISQFVSIGHAYLHNLSYEFALFYGRWSCTNFLFFFRRRSKDSIVRIRWLGY